ncbi:unnamed protein product, partial [Meganyctiphanes norvegica]
SVWLCIQWSSTMFEGVVMVGRSWRRCVLTATFVLLCFYVLATDDPPTSPTPPTDNGIQGVSSAPSSLWDSQYNLPVLEKALDAAQDPQVQRVLRIHKNHVKVPESTPNVKVVLASTWRSGSTFLGEILASYPGVFYHYEPLTPYGLQQIGPGPIQEEVHSLLKEILDCNYQNLEEYLNIAFSNQDMFVRNAQLWSMCIGMPRSKCFIPSNLEVLCSVFPVHVMKIVRARLAVIAPLLNDPQVQLLWLVRDPRAIMNSRTTNVKWCNKQVCSSAASLCSDMMADYQTFTNLKKYHKNIKVVYYEDLAQNTFNKTQEILDFVGLSFHSNIKKYLEDHLTLEKDEPWSTHHNPNSRVGHWKKVMSYDAVIKIQFHCQGVMKALGYQPIMSQRELIKNY